MTPEQKKTLLEMSLLMRKNREREREAFEKMRKTHEAWVEDVAPLEWTEERKQKYIDSLTPEIKSLAKKMPWER